MENIYPRKRHQESVNNGFTCEAVSPDGSLFGSPSPPLRRATKQPRTKKSDLMNNKESTRIAIIDSRPIQDQSSVLKKMVNDYLSITDTTIRDMTPKYIMHSLVLALKDYVREELIGDLLHDRHTPEDLEQLMKATDYLNHINELLAAQETIKQAMIVLDNLTR